MLPEKLSNNICSLRPNEDRLTLSCLMEIDGRGRVHGYSIHESVIRSRHRLVYEDVQRFMDGKADGNLLREHGDIRQELEELYALRKVLTAMRIRRGALDLDIPETEIDFHDDGTVAGICRRSRLEAHRVVEECMLIANEVVASHLFNLHVPSVYRIHEDPDMNKLHRLQPVLAHMGIRFPARKDITSDAIQIALEKAGQLETGFIARRLILRAMMQAHYEDENLGHFGLASSCYTHFTSPIRRYPDLIVHRILRETIRGAAPTSGVYRPPGEIAPEHGVAAERGVPLLAASPLPEARTEELRARLGPVTRHCSARERRAADIENRATTVKTLEHMRGFLEEEFDGYITSVLTWGFFVELRKIPVEGLVHVRKLTDDFYEFDEERMILTGRQTGATFKLGDRVKVVVENVDMAALELDFVLTDASSAKSTGGKRGEASQRKRAREERHTARQPRRGGFQRRGRR
jgi:ribonuclease R